MKISKNVHGCRLSLFKFCLAITYLMKETGHISLYMLSILYFYIFFPSSFIISIFKKILQEYNAVSNSLDLDQA